MVRSWRKRLAQGQPLAEHEALALLDAYGIGTARSERAETADEAAAWSRDIGFPVALKTATPGILHKTEVDGVRLGLVDVAAVRAAYADLAARLGPRVTIAKMAPPGVELAFGMVADPQWGPLVLIAAGGTMIEALADSRLAVPPVSPSGALRLLGRLRCRPLLDPVRGRPGANLASVAEAFARFSRLVADLGPWIGEIDVNPVIAGPDGAVAVDALIAPATQPPKEPQCPRP
jgi:succinyl-CoA synthetase beta subunit